MSVATGLTELSALPYPIPILDSIETPLVLILALTVLAKKKKTKITFVISFDNIAAFYFSLPLLFFPFSIFAVN